MTTKVTTPDDTLTTHGTTKIWPWWPWSPWQQVVTICDYHCDKLVMTLKITWWHLMTSDNDNIWQHLTTSDDSSRQFLSPKSKVAYKTGNFARWKFLARWTDNKQWQVTTVPIFFLILWPFMTMWLLWWLWRPMDNPSNLGDDLLTILRTILKTCWWPWWQLVTTMSWPMMTTLMAHVSTLTYDDA